VRDAELRELYAQVMARRATSNRVERIAPEKLLDLVERQGPEAERLELLDHVMARADLAREFELLRSIAEAQPRERHRGIVPLAIAAGLVMVIGASVIVQQMSDRGPASDVVRGPGDELILVSPHGELAAGVSVTFIWRAVEGAVVYELELLDSDGAILYAASTRDTTLALPAAISLDPGEVYSWWVRAMQADGSERASRVQRMQIEYR
jgi:hypothetical protein